MKRLHINDRLFELPENLLMRRESRNSDFFFLLANIKVAIPIIVIIMQNLSWNLAGIAYFYGSGAE